MSHIPLMRSSLIVAMGTVGLASVAGAATTTYTDSGAFSGAAAGAGLTQQYVEDFESYTIPFGYTFNSPPWTSSVDGSLSMSTAYGSGLFLVKGSYYYPSVPTNAMGTTENDVLVVEFDGGVSATGMDLHGISTFTAGFFQEVNYSVFDTGGGLLDSGTFPGDGSVGAYLGVVSDDLIGSIQLTGSRFGLGAAVYVDNIEGWVPAPGVLSVCGFAGLALRRRRR